MRLENAVWDARDPRVLGGFWAAALGAEVITDEPDLLEARLVLDEGTGAFLDLCFPRVEHPSTAPPRLHLDLRGGGERVDERSPVVQRLLALGARRADVGQGDGVPWTVLADPERDAAFWAAVTGWQRAGDVGGSPALRHPDGVGPLLALCPEVGPKPAGPAGKNRLHLDVRREATDPGEDDGDGERGVIERGVVERLRALGATPLSAPGELPWLVFADPSGNELCVLAPARP
ncbi:VOC family protein [Quadrisphaera sp. KR29]|uniref:VOC family protein n=1 Tax=Quadrisphaera sp. KR29 TaxID=3461391 RepID=UPI004044EF50